MLTAGPWVFVSYSWSPTTGVGTITRERDHRNARGRVERTEQQVEAVAHPACREHAGWSTSPMVRAFLDRGEAFPVRRF